MRTDIIEARKAAKLTQVQLAKKIGLDQTGVSRIELGKSSVSPLVAKRLARHLNLDVLAILFPKKPRKAA